MSSPRTKRVVKKQKPIRVFMDGIDWQHHLGHDPKGTTAYPTKSLTKRMKTCLARGARCGVVEVEVRLVRWVEEQRLDLEMKALRKLK